MSHFRSVTRDTRALWQNVPEPWSAAPAPPPPLGHRDVSLTSAEASGGRGENDSGRGAGRLGVRPPEEDVAGRPLALATGR